MCDNKIEIIIAHKIKCKKCTFPAKYYKHKKKMQKGGVIVFDDFQHPAALFPGVKKACLKFFKEDRVKFIGDSHILNIKDQFFYVPSKTISQGVLLI